MEDRIVTPSPTESEQHSCSCGGAGQDSRKQPINIFNEIAYLTEHMSNLGEDEVQRIVDEFLAGQETSDD